MGMTKTAKGAIRLPYDHLNAYDAFEVLAPGTLKSEREFLTVDTVKENHSSGPLTREALTREVNSKLNVLQI